MSFVNDLDISEEESEFQRVIASSRFKCIVSTELLSLPAKVVLDFRRITETGTQFSILRVEWRHTFPQPFGFHVLPSGNWNVSGVRFSGSLVRKACRLQTVEKVLESNKSQLSGGSSKSKVAVLEQQVKQLTADLEEARKSAAKAKAKLHELRNTITTAKEQAESLDASPNALPDPVTPSSRNNNNGGNDSLFKSWADTGNAD
ncbi:ORF1 [Carrot torradovirus 1]|uniref:ORF1 n=1 Tax=Carrot torradovirus 1 TaxID=1425364 RepID=A0A0A0P3S7_9SECO|nr:ORF1 [Carrot torradovirus 1]AHA85558.1 ORF1 [Carrot torradovirus 1]